MLADPDHWLASTELLDLGDAKVQLRARAITQMAKTEREKVLAVYGFVKRIPFAKPFKLRLKSPRHVLDAGRGDALDKIGLLVALLRTLEIPARIRYMQLPGDMLRGLISHMTSAARPVLEVWHDQRWIATDTYIFDASYLSAARKRLAEEGWECGYGIHRDGESIWNGIDDAFLVGEASARANLAPVDGGVFEDPAQFVASPAFRSTHPPVARTVHWNVMVPSMRKVIGELRKEGTGGSPSTRRRTS